MYWFYYNTMCAFIFCLNFLPGVSPQSLTSAATESGRNLSDTQNGRPEMIQLKLFLLYTNASNEENSVY